MSLISESRWRPGLEVIADILFLFFVQLAEHAVVELNDKQAESTTSS